MSWAIGSGRLLYISVVPPQKKTEYMALYSAWIGITAGLSRLLGGWVVDSSAGLTGQFLFLTVDSYTILFAGGLTLSMISALFLRSVRADSTVSTGEFAGMFVRGNPLMAVESLIRYHRAKDERATVEMTERLGRTGSPLTVDELLQALDDPRFNVRFEAIVSIARRGPDERLTQALTQVLGGSEPALSVIAAWALGRIGDEAALASLRAGLNARYRSVQAHCARSLGTLRDRKVVPILLERLATETDKGLRMAYAAALGKLEVAAATDQLLSFLYSSQDEATQMELALALARIVGQEHHFIQLLRAVSEEPGTAASQAITEAKKRIEEFETVGDELSAMMEECADAMARGELAQGTKLLSRLIRRVPGDGFCETCAVILLDCADRLDEFGASRTEYLLLALHAIHAGVVRQQSRNFTRAFSLKGTRS
jgi:hypothetical protein